MWLHALHPAPQRHPDSGDSPLALLERIKIAANKRDVLYQSLIKTWLAEKADSG